MMQARLGASALGLLVLSVVACGDDGDAGGAGDSAGSAGVRGGSAGKGAAGRGGAAGKSASGGASAKGGAAGDSGDGGAPELGGDGGDAHGATGGATSAGGRGGTGSGGKSATGGASGDSGEAGQAGAAPEAVHVQNGGRIRFFDASGQYLFADEAPTEYPLPAGGYVLTDHAVVTSVPEGQTLHFAEMPEPPTGERQSLTFNVPDYRAPRSSAARPPSRASRTIPASRA